MSEFLQDKAADEECFSEVDGERLILSAAVLSGGEVPGQVLIAPWGEVCSENGRFVVDEESVQSVLAAFQAHGTDVPVDYEHQSLGGPYASPSGQAPAAGWIRQLHAVAPAAEPGELQPGLWGRVDWTEAAKAKLSAREYRYLSPVVMVRKRDRRVVALHSAALTNKPAIAGMQPIVNREAGPAGESERATTAGVEEAAGLLRARLGLGAEAEVQTVITAAERRLAELEQEAAARGTEALVTAAMRAGKLTAGMKSWAEALAAKDPAGFQAWAASAPQVVMLGRTEPPGRRAGRSAEALAASARLVFQQEPALALLTSEAAWVAEALREAGLRVEETVQGD